MFKVMNPYGTVFTVYAIRTNVFGMLEFLIYNNHHSEKWRWEDAEYYSAIDEDRCET